LVVLRKNKKVFLIKMLVKRKVNEIEKIKEGKYVIDMSELLCLGH